MLKKLVKGFSKNKLKIDNYGQNLMDPLIYHKSKEKLFKMDPKYSSVLEDPHLSKQTIFKKEYLLNLKRWPDDNEVLIDITKFNFIEYIKFLSKSNFDKLEEKDQFPYRALQTIFLFIAIEISINIFYYTLKQYYAEYEKEDIKPHFNYNLFEKDLRYCILLFNKSVQ